MISLQGCWLLASPELRDGNFAKSAVLILRHDEDGALGIVMNRPSTFGVAALLDEPVAAALAAAAPAILEGGPCEGPLIAVHPPGLLGVIGNRVMDGVAWTVDATAVESLLTGNEKPLAIALGYSGWGAQQLEAELAHHAWLVTRATDDEIFDRRPGMYDRILRRISRESVLNSVPKHLIPPDPTMN
jgi:putative transcriptional regulator